MHNGTTLSGGMPRRTLLAALAAAAPGSAFAAHDDLGDLVESARAAHAVPAMSALVIRDFSASREAVRGVCRLGSPRPARPGQRWHLGSDGKAMTATLVARAVEGGRLSWSARLDQMLPKIADRMHPAYRGVTLLQLMSHTAGLPENHDDDAFIHAFYADTRPLPEQRLAYVSVALADPPVAPPGKEFHYSNTGFIIAGVLAERAFGQSYEQLMHRLVFRPLGMSSPTYVQAPGPDEPSGHVDGRIADHPFDANPAIFAPAGEARMSLQDWARFCIDQMRGERGQGRLLKRDTYALLHTRQGASGAGLGWGVQPAIAGLRGPVWTHAGSDGNWYAAVALFPASGNGVLAVANAAESMGGDKATTELLRKLLPRLAPPLG